jgi:hypothetical protein
MTGGTELQIRTECPKWRRRCLPGPGLQLSGANVWHNPAGPRGHGELPAEAARDGDARLSGSAAGGQETVMSGSVLDGAAGGGRGPRRTRLADDLAGLDARSADSEPLRRPSDDGPHGLDVGVPASAGAAVRVRDLVAEARLLAADVANGSHGIAPGVGRDGRWPRPAHVRRSSRRRISDLSARTRTGTVRRSRAAALSTVPPPILPVW